LRNREGKRYRTIQEYLRKNESKVILLSATPYNKTYIDLSNQLRLFLPALVSAKSGSFPLSKAVGREGADAFLTPMPLHTLGQMHCHRRLFP